MNCYNIYNACDKKYIDNTICVGILGGYMDIWDVINRLQTKNLEKIKIYIFARKATFVDLTKINSNIDIEYIADIDTNEMMNKLQHISYIMCGGISWHDHNNGMSSSGSNHIALSALCKIILCNPANDYLQIKSALSIDFNSKEPIILESNIDFKQIEEERNTYIHKRNILLNSIYQFENLCKCEYKPFNISTIPKRIIQTWIRKDISTNLQKFVNSWKEYNPNYEYTLYDNDESLQFIQKNFNNIVVESYNNLHSGAFKADLFRLCELYINGGFYCDIDTLCISKIDNILCDNLSFSIPIDLNIQKSEGEHNLFNSFILSTPRNPILLQAIHKIVENITTKNISKTSLLDITGPGIIGRATNIIFNREETTSYVGMEGDYTVYDNNIIRLLKFEPNSEYVKNIDGTILFQNKNGNYDIIKAYNEECAKLSNYKSYINSKILVD